jgi:hypothetical protein
MIVDSVAGQGKLSFIPSGEELSQQLIEQFYAGSIGRYGTESEQPRIGVAAPLTAWGSPRCTQPAKWEGVSWRLSTRT